MNAFRKIIKTGSAILLIGVIGVLLCETTAGIYLEEEIGLTWLFKLRGPLPPPDDVVIVSIDEASAEILHLPDEPEKWSRKYYTTLAENLNQQKAALIAFNIHFGESREPENDVLLAKALAENRNIILGGLVKRPSSNGRTETHLHEGREFRVIEPVTVLRQAALDVAPFLLPKTSSTVKEYWTRFGPDRPTFPASIFQHVVVKDAYNDIRELLLEIDRSAFAKLPASFDRFSAGSEILYQDIQAALQVSSSRVIRHIDEGQYSPETMHFLKSWLGLGAKERLYLNYYGDVGAITTIPFFQAITANVNNPDLFRNKIVLVGYADSLEPDKQQGLYTVFSQETGNVISPTEIAATAVANLLDESWLKPLPSHQQAVLTLFWGMLLSIVFRCLSYKSSIKLTFLLVVAYIAISRQFFMVEAIWLPLAIPIIQAGMALLWQSMDYFIKVSRVSGYYLPKAVFAINANYPDAMNHYGTLMHGVCMATDAGQYTTLSEGVSPLQLNKLMNDYYGAIFPKVKQRHGLISDVVGDSMLAVWAEEKTSAGLRREACCAALEIKTAIDRFNDGNDYPLATRIGLHYGEMRLGNVGAKEHYEYRAVGDTVNTATRIEELNKMLGTRILVSTPVMTDMPEFFCRELGAFLLKGKTNPVSLLELLGYEHEIEPAQRQLAEMFAKALGWFKESQWLQAFYEFRAVHAIFPDDGPTSFYVSYLQRQLTLLSQLETNAPKPIKSSKDYAGIIDIGNITVLLH